MYLRILKIILGFVFVTCIAALSWLGYIQFFQKPKPLPAVFLWQNYTSNHQASFTAILPPYKTVKYFFENNTELYPVRRVNYENFAVEHLLVSDIYPKKSYTLTIQNEKKEVLAKKTFKALDLNRRSFTIVATSCMDDRWDMNIQKEMWKDLLSFQPDMIFLIGDNVYADFYTKGKIARPEHFSNRYFETISRVPLYSVSDLIPILALWDDHDYGENNGNKKFQHKGYMQELFRSFYPLYSDDEFLFKGPGVGFALKTSMQDFFFMDDRSFRDSYREGSLWGKKQTQWLLEGLSQKAAWLVNGGQIHGRHQKFESFEMDFPRDFEKTIKKLQSSPSPLFFLSGDRHLTELLKMEDWPYKTYELTTSPLHAKTYPTDPSKDSRIVHHVSNTLNYAVIKSEGVLGGGLIMEIFVYGPKKTLLFSEKFTIYKK